jgi:hypothetical protein
MKHITICWIGDPTPEQVIGHLDKAVPHNLDSESYGSMSGLRLKDLTVMLNQATMRMIEFEVDDLEKAWKIYDNVRFVLEHLFGNYTINVKSGIGLSGSLDFLFLASRYEQILLDVHRQIKRKKYSVASIRRQLKDAFENVHGYPRER